MINYVYAVNIGAVTENRVKDCKRLISPERLKRVKRYRLERDRVRTVFGELLVRYVLQKRYDFAQSDICFGYEKYGKPVFKSPQNIFFNISHSGCWVVCSVGDCHMGIDVEEIQEGRLGIAKCFYTAHENARIQYFSNLTEQLREFYTIWTLKESYLKAIGVGLRQELNSFEFRWEQGEERLYIEGVRCDEYHFLKYSFGEKYCMALCTKAEFVDSVKEVSPDEVINLLISS